MSDRLYRFLFEEADVRGEIVQLDAAYREVLRRGSHPPVVARLLGEAMAAALLLSATLKSRGGLALQLQGEGPVSMLLVQTSGGTVRATVQCRSEVPDAPLREQTGAGLLSIILDPDDETHRYQGLVELDADSLAEALERYFRDSEQLPTRLWLSAAEGRAAGMLLQQVPGADTEDIDAWERAGHLAATLQHRELLQLDPPEVLRRLYHEEDIRLFEPSPVSFRCRCSRERVAGLLLALGAEEARSLVAERGEVEVHCEFCGQGYRFDPVDVEQLLADPDAPPPSGTQH